MRRRFNLLLSLAVCLQLSGCAVSGAFARWTGTAAAGGTFGATSVGTGGVTAAVPPYGIPLTPAGSGP